MKRNYNEGVFLNMASRRRTLNDSSFSVTGANTSQLNDSSIYSFDHNPVSQFYSKPNIGTKVNKNISFSNID